jgi:hypothetical protein
MKSMATLSSRVAALALIAALAACSDHPQATLQEPHPDVRTARLATAAPAPLALITVGGTTMQAFPYLVDDLTSTPRDPVNLVFAGQADPRAIRATLMALDGDRSGSPLAPFDCTWNDAVGGLQAAWSETAGWSGSAIQLECGTYGPIRFHLRLFDAGAVTLGGAHFEFLIPGTTDHQVVSWELAEQLVTYDLARAGVLGAAPGSTGPLNAAPSFRAIPGFLYDLAVASDPAFGFLLGQLGLVNLANGDKGIPTDGMATVLVLAGSAPLVTATATQDFEVPFGQLIPKPFCLEGAPSPYLYVSGPVRLTLSSRQGADGTFDQDMRAQGRLTLTPWNPMTNSPAGESYLADVGEFQQSRIDRRGASIHGIQQQHEIPAGAPGRGRLQIQLKVVSPGVPQYAREVHCQ